MSLCKNKASLGKLKMDGPGHPKTPPSAREKETVVKTKFSSNAGGLYQDNSEYWSYVTEASHSNKKAREFSNDNLNNPTYGRTAGSAQANPAYLNRRESTKSKVSSNKNTINHQEIQNSRLIHFRGSNQVNKIPIIFNDSEQNSWDKIRTKNYISNMFRAYNKKYPKVFDQEQK
jgi:hypothetical protein